MKKRIWLSRTIMIVIGIFLLASGYIYLNLDVGSEPQKSDIIISLEGGFSDRADKAVELLEAGYSEEDIIIISPYFEVDNFSVSDWYLDAGAEPNNLVNEYESTSTWTNAINTLRMMDENDWESAIIVTSDYHTRRTKLSYDRANVDYGFDLTIVSSYTIRDGEFVTYMEATSSWWQTILEVGKVWGYIFELYHFVDL